MFKNPLKYQEGGSVQDAMKQLVAWIVQNTGLDEGQVSQRLNQILSDDTAKQELVTNLQNMQKGDREAEERIKNMFIPQNAKFGGKIQDFICKHAKGGKAGCGCKKAEGGEIENGEMVQKHALGSDGIDKYSASGKRLKLSEVPNMPTDFNPTNVTMETLPNGTRRVVFNGIDGNGQAVADTNILTNNGVRYKSPHVLTTWSKHNNKAVTPSENAWYDSNFIFDDAKDDNIINASEFDNGGKVVMNQGGGNNWFTRMYNRFIGRRVPDTVEATDRRLKTWTDANGVQHIVEDANVNGNSTVTTIDINGADTLGKEKITTGDGRYRMLNLQPGTPEWRAVMSRNVQEQENGGLIEAGKKGISRLEALNKAKELYGYNDSQAKFAYANAKNALRNQGLRGRKLKQSAREMISKRERQKIEAVDPNSKVQGFNAPILPDWNNLPEQKIVGDLTPRMTNNYDSLSFSNAFRAARNKAGGDNGVFSWRGKRYTTQLGKKTPTSNTTTNTTTNTTYTIPGLEPVVINNPEIQVPEYEPLQIEAISTPPVSEILYPGLKDMIEGRASISSSWPILQWMQNQKENGRKIVFAPYTIRNKQPRVLTVSSPALYTPSPMAFKTGGKIEKAQQGVEFPSDTTKVTYGSYRVFPKLMNLLGIDSTPFDYEYISWNNEDGSSPYLQMPLQRADWFNYHDGKHIGLPNSYETELQRPYKHSWNGFLSTPAGKIHRPVDKNTYNKADSLIRANRQNNDLKDQFKNGGKVEKAQDGTRSLYQQITADGPETYTDGYGTVRQMNESPVIAGLRKAYHWINMDRTLSDNAYSQKHGYAKPITGMPPAVYVSPVAQEIELAKLIGNRIPTQGKRVPYYGKVKVNPKRRPLDYDIDKVYSSKYPLKKNNIASGIQMEAEHPEMLDYDIDKIFTKTINPIEYDIKPIRLEDIVNVPKFIGNAALRMAPGIIGSAAAGSYVATKKDKNKKSENK